MTAHIARYIIEGPLVTRRLNKKTGRDTDYGLFPIDTNTLLLQSMVKIDILDKIA